jgi:hypothetical protein
MAHEYEMVTKRLSFRYLSGALAAAALAIGLGGFILPAAAQEDDEPFEQKVMRAILGNPRGDIDYRERSPLVIPPGRDLPAPETTATVDANPAWPKDPESAKKAKNAGRVSAFDSEREAGRPLSPDEIRRGTAARKDKIVPSKSDNESGRALLPSEYNKDGNSRSIFNVFGGGKQQAQAFEEEPSRTRMTQPPPGYRTPSPSQPYAPPKETGWFKLPSVFDRGLSSDK